MTPAERYPGLYEEFTRWFIGQSEKAGEHEYDRDETSIKNVYFEFMYGDDFHEECFFMGNLNQHVKYPPYLTAMRDMALV